MNRCAILMLATCLVAVGCGDDDNGTGPSGGPMVFTADLRPANEVPPIGNAESGGSGSAQITIANNQATMFFQLTGFPADTRVVGAHIHRAPAGVNGGILVNTGVSAASPVSLSNPISEFSVSGVPVDASLVQEIANNPAGFYFNVHSPLNPGGFARGQLVRIQ
jgi:hypothetical protein